MVKKIVLIIFVLLLPAAALATQQASDILHLDGKRYSLVTHWAYQSPLEIFYSVSQYPYPFQRISTGNYRGFVATWKIEDSTLYLTEITIPQYMRRDSYTTDVPLQEIFFEHVGSYGVHATWFTGIIRCYSEEEIVFIQIEDGTVSKIFPFERAVNSEEAEFTAIYDEYKAYTANQIDDNSQKFPTLTEEQYSQTSKYIHTIYAEGKKKFQQYIQKEKEENRKIAYALYSNLPGYDEALDDYQILESDRGYHLSLGGAVSVKLTRHNDSKIQFKWYILTEDFKTTEYTWYDFLEASKNTLALVDKQAWLVEWLHEVPERRLRIRLYGKAGYFLSDYESEHLFQGTWYHANLEGEPYCEILIDDEFGNWLGSVYLGLHDDRALIESLRSSVSGGREYVPEEFIREIHETGKHWLSVVSLSFHHTQDIPEYLIVDPSGNWRCNQEPKTVK